ncbi:LAETG motif-containing sortase-dependent surface protein [Streptomyces sp. 8L]|uniref:LAETG motif-containing sortase-dependent surface protein n=1 Tax=unclassified Streptomyces TaxID=2593676 RepID=UPI001CD706E0|nr:LAETG motif-containing sortase-dependent surface protein [Streptomyces sp. 8L]MCA1223828.1 LPXTG cell wall anchor domain-containing protein [Streptomyces sp. 8L]
MTRFGSLRRPGALISVAAAGVLGVGLAAGPASAHTPSFKVDCSSATVDLSAYNGGVTNHVKVTVQGDDALTVDQDFKDSYHTVIKLPDHSSPVDVHLVVTAGDSAQYNVDKTATAPVCAGHSAPPSSSAPSTPPAKPSDSASSTPASPAPSASTSSAAAVPASPSPSGDNLAETGSSSSTPVIAGAAAVVVIAGAGILWASRRRRTAQH